MHHFPAARPGPACLLSTLGTEPQVVTLSLQALTHAGEQVDQVIVLHTSGGDRQLVKATRDLDEAFASAPLLARWHGAYRRVPISGAGGPVSDLVTEEDFGAALRTIYQAVRDLKQGGWRVHLNASGGRKLIALCASTVAQLLFDVDDRLWYLQSSPELVASRELFAANPDEVALFQIPLLRWSPAPPILTDVALADDPVAAITRQHERMAAAKLDFLSKVLTHAEREVAEEVIRTGATDVEVAARLHKSERTVAHQLATIYDKLRAFLGIRDDLRVDRHTLIAEFAGILPASRAK